MVEELGVNREKDKKGIFGGCEDIDDSLLFFFLILVILFTSGDFCGDIDDSLLFFFLLLVLIFGGCFF